jgi:hypothetical protein
MYQRQDWVVCTGFIWLSIGTRSEYLNRLSGCIKYGKYSLASDLHNGLVFTI